MKTLFCITLMAWSGFGQANPPVVAGPVLGLVFDAGSGAVRWLPGIPASATLGDPVDSGPALRQAVVSGEGRYAIGTEAAHGNTVLISAAGRQPLAGVGPDAGLMVVSPRGTAAAIYFDQMHTALVLSGMPGAPQIAREVTLDNAPLALAVSDDASSLLAALRTGRDTEVVYSYQAGQSPQTVLSSRGVAALEFMPGSLDALVAETNAVTVVSNGSGPQLLAGERDGIAKVAAIAGSSDGSKVVIAMRSGQVAFRDLQTGAQVVLSCACTPSGAARLRGNAVFRLNELGNGPLWVLDADGAEPRILFVAAPAGVQ